MKPTLNDKKRSFGRSQARSMARPPRAELTRNVDMSVVRQVLVRAKSRTERRCKCRSLSSGAGISGTRAPPHSLTTSEKAAFRAIF